VKDDDDDKTNKTNTQI